MELLEGDLLAPVAGRRFDLVVSNPPYVAAGDEVDPEVAQYEPAASRSTRTTTGRAILERLAEGARELLSRAATSRSSSATARRRGSPSASTASATRSSR